MKKHCSHSTTFETVVCQRLQSIEHESSKYLYDVFLVKADQSYLT